MPSVPDSVSCSGETPGTWTDPLPLTTALSAPLEVPLDAFPTEVQNQLTIMPDLTLGPQEPAATGVPTLSIEPSMYMLENDGQANALAANWGDHWLGADEYTRSLMESVLSPSPRSDGPQLLFPNSSMASALGHLSNASSQMLAPAGMEYRWNQSTGSTNLVSRGSLYP